MYYSSIHFTSGQLFLDVILLPALHFPRHYSPHPTPLPAVLIFLASNPFPFRDALLLSSCALAFTAAPFTPAYYIPAYCIPRLPTVHLSSPLFPTLYSPSHCNCLPNTPPSPLFLPYQLFSLEWLVTSLQSQLVMLLLFPSPVHHSPRRIIFLTVLIPLYSLPRWTPRLAKITSHLPTLFHTSLDTCSHHYLPRSTPLPDVLASRIEPLSTVPPCPNSTSLHAPIPTRAVPQFFSLHQCPTLPCQLYFSLYSPPRCTPLLGIITFAPLTSLVYSSRGASIWK